MAVWMCIALFVFLFAGEYLISEPEVKYRYDRPDSCCVYPGRLTDWEGDPLYTKVQVGNDNSRHFSWIFHCFVFMQIWNMVCSRKIHDEFNVFEGVFSNPMFLLVWLFIVIGQIAISFSGQVFKLHPAGLSPIQHLEAIGYALSVFVVNAILKCVPDWIIPFQLGPDSVYDREKAKNGAEQKN